MKRVETWCSCNILTVNFIYNNSYNSNKNILYFVDVVLYNYQLTHDVNNIIYIEFVKLLWRLCRPEINNIRSGCIN